MDEDVARNFIEDITGSIPTGARAVVCGDWNTRIGQLYPKIGETDIPRRSVDTRTSQRAPWFIETCE
jgi:hypothetical protein